MSDSYREGRDAFVRGQKLKDCPHKGSKGLKQEDWEFGWRDARNDQAKEAGFGNRKKRKNEGRD